VRVVVTRRVSVVVVLVGLLTCCSSTRQRHNENENPPGHVDDEDRGISGSRRKNHPRGGGAAGCGRLQTGKYLFRLEIFDGVRAEVQFLQQVLEALSVDAAAPRGLGHVAVRVVEQPQPVAPLEGVDEPGLGVLERQLVVGVDGVQRLGLGGAFTRGEAAVW
jgi:hypothetical protein